MEIEKRIIDSFKVEDKEVVLEYNGWLSAKYYVGCGTNMRGFWTLFFARLFFRKLKRRYVN